MTCTWDSLASGVRCEKAEAELYGNQQRRDRELVVSAFLFLFFYLSILLTNEEGYQHAVESTHGNENSASSVFSDSCRRLRAYNRNPDQTAMRIANTMAV